MIFLHNIHYFIRYVLKVKKNIKQTRAKPGAALQTPLSLIGSLIH